MAKRAVAVRISGQEYRIKSDADESSLQRVANCVDAAMDQIRSRTGTVDSLDVAILTSLNLAREVLSLRERVGGAGNGEPDPDRLRELIELAESALDTKPRVQGNTPLLTLPTGDEMDDAQTDLLGPLLDGPEIEPSPASV
jgi:cell division protein ZapA (FtsZ GTPase activity inhibitor)